MPPFEIKIKEFPFELKAVDDAGTFEGLASVYDVKDDLGDVIHRGAFARTLAHKNGRFPLLWQHRVDEPIGFGEAKDNAVGLEVKGQLNMGVARAKEVHALMKQAKAAGVAFGLSIGYDAINPKWEGETRHLREIRLWEISPTLFPAQPLALVGNVKSAKQEGAGEGKPFGSFDSFEDCVSKNGDKDDPEAFCAWMEHQMTGSWPAEASRWGHRVASLFERTPEIKMTREEVGRFCASCAEKMATLGLATVSFKASMIDRLPESLRDGLYEAYSQQKAFFVDCVEQPPMSVDDPGAFCAWFQKQLTGAYPPDALSVVRGTKHGLRHDLLPSLRALASEAYSWRPASKAILTDAIDHLQQGMMALMVLQLSEPAMPSEGEPDQASTISDADFYSLSHLLREMRAAVRSMRPEPANP